MFESLDDIIKEDITSSKKLLSDQIYHKKYVQEFIPEVKYKQSSYSLFIDDWREPLTMPELLLFNALRSLHQDYNFHYKSMLFILSKEKSYSTFMRNLDELERKGYVIIKTKKKYKFMFNHIIHNRRDSKIQITCVNQFGKVLNEWSKF